MTLAECQHSKNARQSSWAFLLLLLFSWGCTAGSREAREEFSRIAHAIDALRAADNSHKAQMIQPLRAVSCSQFCSLRDQCVRAYETHIRALHLIDRARLGSEIASRELDTAEKTLKQAKELATACAAAQAELGRDSSR
jgi:hypothetical protein